MLCPMLRARFLFLIAIGLLVIPLARAEVLVSGRVLDENNAAVGGARVSFRLSGSLQSAQSVTTPTGRFELRLPGDGEYLVNVQHDGYFQLRDRRLEVSGQNHELTLVVNHVREVFQKLEVDDAPPPIDIDKTSSEQRLSGPEVMNIPVQSAHTLRNSIRVMPSVLQDPQGELHFNGGAENQVLYTLNGFNIGDPLTGRFDTKLSVEAVRSLEFSTGRFSPEFGRKWKRGRAIVRASSFWPDRVAGGRRFAYKPRLLAAAVAGSSGPVPGSAHCARS